MTKKSRSKTTSTKPEPAAPVKAKQFVRAKKVAKKTAPAKAKPARAGEPSTPDARLPPPGTVIKKLDRRGNVRCECKVESDGIHYRGKVYSSLSAAAAAASTDLKLSSTAVNGFAFWGLSKRADADPVATLERAWERCWGAAESAVSAPGDDRSKLRALIGRYVTSLSTLRDKVA